MGRMTAFDESSVRRGVTSAATNSGSFASHQRRAPGVELHDSATADMHDLLAPYGLTSLAPAHDGTTLADALRSLRERAASPERSIAEVAADLVPDGAERQETSIERCDGRVVITATGYWGRGEAAEMQMYGLDPAEALDHPGIDPQLDALVNHPDFAGTRPVDGGEGGYEIAWFTTSEDAEYVLDNPSAGAAAASARKLLAGIERGHVPPWQALPQNPAIAAELRRLFDEQAEATVPAPPVVSVVTPVGKPQEPAHVQLRAIADHIDDPDPASSAPYDTFRWGMRHIVDEGLSARVADGEAARDARARSAALLREDAERAEAREAFWDESRERARRIRRLTSNDSWPGSMDSIPDRS